MNEPKVLPLRLPARLYDDLKAEAEAQGLSMSALVRVILQAALKSKKNQERKRQ